MVVICRYLDGNTHILCFLYIFHFGKSLDFALEKNSNYSNCVNVKKHMSNIKNVCLPIRTMFDSTLFTSKLSFVTVGFLVRNGFGVP